MIIKQIIEDRFKANSFVIIIGNDCVIIDMNTNVLPFILENHLTPKYLFFTHEHFDHIKGAGALKKQFPNIKVISSKITSDLVADSKGNMSFFIDGEGIEEIPADIYIENVSQFKFCDKTIDVYCTPGHTSGGIIIHIDNALFTGDTLLDIKTPTTLPNSSKIKLRESLDFIDNNFDDNIIFYQGHGKPFSKKDWDKEKSIGKKRNQDNTSSK